MWKQCFICFIKTLFDLLPFYAILRSIPNKLLGVIAMFAAILVLLALPFLDPSKIRGITFKPTMKFLFWIFVVNFLTLMVLGAKHVETPFIELGQICTFFYFAWFMLLIPGVFFIDYPLWQLSGANKNKWNSKHTVFSLGAYWWSGNNNNNGEGEGNNEENIYKWIDDTSAAAESDAASASAPTSVTNPNESFVRDESTIGFDRAQQNMVEAELVVHRAIDDLGLSKRYIGEDGVIEHVSSGPESIETRTPETDIIIEAAGTVVNSLVSPVEAYLETALDDPYGNPEEIDRLTTEVSDFYGLCESVSSYFLAIVQS